MPVDVYIGGAEHGKYLFKYLKSFHDIFLLILIAITHLFVSRLMSHFFYDLNKLKKKEPFQRFISIGMVKGESFKTKEGKYIETNFAEEKGMNITVVNRFS
jgi:leucyl-tRNA synthetase